MDARARAKEIIVEIIRQAGGTFEGKLRLYKTFYFAHLYYYEKTGGCILSEWPIVRMPEGPGIDMGDVLIRELIDSGILERSSRPSGPYSEQVFRLLTDRSTSLDACAMQAIYESWNFVSKKTAQELSAITHEKSRAWKDAENGEELNVYIDTFDDDELEDRRVRCEEARKAIESALGSS